MYLSAAARAIIIGWHKRAQESVYGKGGRKRRPAVLDVSDDEGDDLPAAWAGVKVKLSEPSRLLAVRWLRTARANLQAARGLDGSQDPNASLKTRRRKPTDKYKSGKKSKTRRK